MNRIIAQQLKEIARTVEDLKKAAALEQERVAALAKSRDDLQRKLWSQTKEAHVFKDHLEVIPELRRENEQFREVRAELETRLREILACTRALSTEFRP